MTDHEDITTLSIDEMEVYRQAVIDGNRDVKLSNGTEIVRGRVRLVLLRSSSVIADMEDGTVEEITLSRMATRH